MRRPAVLAILPILAACSTVPVTPAGSRVVLVPAPDPACQLIGPVVGGAALGSPRDPDLLDQATADVRNAAAEQGADTLVVSPPQLLDGGVAISGVAYRCGPYAVDGWMPAVLPFGAKVLRAPHPKAEVLETLPPRSGLQVSERVANGYRRVKREGAATAFVEDAQVELVR